MRVVILLLAILGLSAFVGCQSKPMVVSESGSESEGIKVHGDWTVEVTNPDGSLATRKQFSNHITEEGFGFLAALMTNDQSIVSRRINFLFDPHIIHNHPDGDLFCNDADSLYAPATIPNVSSVISADQKGSIWSVGCIVDLRRDQYRHTTSTLQGGEIATISGSATINDSGDASFVTISQQDLLPRIEVVVGQRISATVVYSFKNSDRLRLN